MSARYRAIKGLTYPATPADLRVVQMAGGVSQLTSAQLASVTFRRVEAGDECLGLPATSVPWLLEQHQIEALPDPPRGRRREHDDVEP